MKTGAAWNLDNPHKPVAEFDPDDILDIPVGWDAWFAEIGSTYGSHVVLAAAPLVVISSTASGAVTNVRMSTDGTGTLGLKYPFTVRVIATSGERRRRTLWLKLVAN